MPATICGEWLPSDRSVRCGLDAHPDGSHYDPETDTAWCFQCGCDPEGHGLSYLGGTGCPNCPECRAEPERLRDIRKGAEAAEAVGRG